MSHGGWSPSLRGPGETNASRAAKEKKKADREKWEQFIGTLKPSTPSRRFLAAEAKRAARRNKRLGAGR